jgi:hypothetical protein
LSSITLEFKLKSFYYNIFNRRRRSQSNDGGGIATGACIDQFGSKAYAMDAIISFSVLR